MPELLTIAQLAIYLKMPVSSIYSQTRSRHRARYGDRALPFIKINGAIRFRKQDIVTWLDRLAEQETD
jgi:hypothetical protein